MKFDPFNIEDEKPLMEGIATFEILSNKDGISEAGNDKIMLTLKVWDACQTEGLIYDHIPITFQWKIKHLLQSVGKEEFAEKGELPENALIGLSGRARIRKETSEKYGTSFKIKDYLLAEKKEEVLNDALPF